MSNVTITKDAERWKEEKAKERASGIQIGYTLGYQDLLTELIGSKKDNEYIIVISRSKDEENNTVIKTTETFINTETRKITKVKFNSSKKGKKSKVTIGFDSKLNLKIM